MTLRTAKAFCVTVDYLLRDKEHYSYDKDTLYD